MSKPRPRFGELLRQAREKAEQSTEIMSQMLGLSEHEYMSIELGEMFPDEETLKRICLMLEWNFYEARRLITNDFPPRPVSMGVAAPGKTPGAKAAGAMTGPGAIEALQSLPLENEAGQRGRQVTLGGRLREVREETSQSPEIIAMLLGLDAPGYMRLEEGEIPPDDLLRRISMVYNWNYLDLQSMLRSQQAHALQPRRHGHAYAGSSPHAQRLKPIISEMEGLFSRLEDKEQQIALAQLELVLETMRRQQKTAAPRIA
ncbi:MAG: helix-turn-helix domain-containing protein [Deltaproteobacteria bacterium]|nr:helix-turn-helix domain-containing protein [Deltaproteobacteria bacterium]